MTDHATEPSTPDAARVLRGQRAYLSGLNAEGRVTDHYLALGYERLEERWRGAAGEIDLIFWKDEVFVFVEVKASKRFAGAAEHLRPAQMKRIMRSAEDYIGRQPKGLLSDMRIDVALVDETGAIEVIENALM
ncbi:YraN family protein [Celeribacter sp.]|uniref:YraN family protein n=1 Tax=Celeribacter sp. TaxID=1890673 RepID=UPI003A91FF95